MPGPHTLIRYRIFPLTMKEPWHYNKHSLIFSHYRPMATSGFLTDKGKSHKGRDRVLACIRQQDTLQCKSGKNCLKFTFSHRILAKVMSKLSGKRNKTSTPLSSHSLIPGGLFSSASSSCSSSSSLKMYHIPALSARFP